MSSWIKILLHEFGATVIMSSIPVCTWTWWKRVNNNGAVLKTWPYPQIWIGEKEQSTLQNTKFPIGYPNQYTPEERQRYQWPKCCDNNNDEDNSQNINNINNSQLYFLAGQSLLQRSQLQKSDISRNLAFVSVNRILAIH